MKKLLLSCLFLLSITFHCAFAATSVEFAIDSADYYVQSGEVTKNTALAAPYIKNDRTMVPVRALCEAFGSTVGWDDATRTVTISNGDTNLSLVINSDKVTVNEEEKTLDCPAEIVNDITFIPLRAVSENLGYYVYYVDATRQILIDEKPAVLTVNGVDASFGVASNVIEYYVLAAESMGNTTSKQNYIGQTYALLEEVSLINSYAKEENITLTEEEKAYFIQMADEIKNDSSLNTKLLSSAFIKFEQDYGIAAKYADSIANSIEISDEDAKKYYTDNFVCAKHVLIGINDERTEEEALALALEVYDRAVAGEDFDLLVDEYGEDPGMVDNAQGYVFTKGQMVAEFEETAFALNNGEISVPVKTSYGYHVIAKLPLPNDASYFNSIKQSLISSEYMTQMNAIYNSAAITHNISENDFAELVAE